MIQSIKYIILIKKAQRRNRKEPLMQDYEIHHIIPKCCRGNNESANLIRLTYQEHYNAHKELALSNPEIIGLQIAWYKMSHFRRRGNVFVSEDEYAESKSRFCEAMKKRFSGKPNPRTAEANAKRIWTTESRNKISDKMKQRVFTDSHREKLQKAAYCKKVRCLTDGIEYVSATAAAKHYGIDTKTVTRRCYGQFKGRKDGIKLDFEYI